MDAEELAEKRQAEAVEAIMAQRRAREEAGRRRPVSAYLLGGYYLVTPAFMLVERVYGIQLRVPSILAEAEQRYVYVGLCFVFGVMFFVLGRLAAWIAVLESTVNIMLVMGGFAKAILSVLTAAVDDPTGFDPTFSASAAEVVVGGVMALAIWVFAFRCATGAAARFLKEAQEDGDVTRP